MIIMEIILIILTVLALIGIGYGKQVLHKRMEVIMSGVYMLCLVLLVLFAGLAFTGPNNEYYWVQQAIRFR